MLQFMQFKYIVMRFFHMAFVAECSEIFQIPHGAAKAEGLYMVYFITGAAAFLANMLIALQDNLSYDIP